MRVILLAALCAATGPASAEPCAISHQVSMPLRPGQTEPVSAEGGIVVGELPAFSDQLGKSPDRGTWTVRVGGKTVAASMDTIAPGLVVYRPPSGAKSYELHDAGGKRVAGAKLSATLPELLEAPRIVAITSGSTNTRHPTTFVSVVLDSNAPATAVALVVQKVKGPALSWGRVLVPGRNVTVYSTQGGCVLEFPDGTVPAQPDDIVTAFWVDDTGRRSRVSAQIVVEKLKQ